MASESADGLPEQAPTKHQMKIARYYTEKFALPNDEESVLDLARLVPDGFNADRPEDKAWIYLLAHGRRPTPREIKSRLWHRRRHEAHAPLRAALLAKARERIGALDLNALGPEVATWVQAYYDEHDTGPLWSEVGQTFEWDHDHTEVVLVSLCRTGWLNSTGETRSLRARRTEPLRPDVPPQADETTTTPLQARG